MLSHPAPAPQRPEKRLLTAWLMLLLDDCACHGYGLQAKLQDCRLSPDPAALYRTLRKLEHDGWVASEWAQPVAGPRRRVYRLTLEGRQSLDEMAVSIRAARDHHDRFLQARAAL